MSPVLLLLAFAALVGWTFSMWQRDVPVWRGAIVVDAMIVGWLVARHEWVFVVPAVAILALDLMRPVHPTKARRPS